MTKKTKWRIGLCKSTYYSIEVVAPNENMAISKAYEEYHKFPEDNICAEHEIFTGIFIDDSNKSGDKSFFYPYIQDAYGNLEDD